MSKVRVKICGLRDTAMAHVATDAGADYLGLVFVPHTPRYITAQQAAIISHKLSRMSNVRPATVGLFLNAPIDEMCTLADTVGLDYFQLTGNEPLEIVAKLNRPVIKTLRCGGQRYVDELINEAAAWQAAGATVLLDAPGVAGGHGKPADWDYACAVALRQPIILAGGLNPTNVAAAIEFVAPAAVDVSSGVERERGIKDAELIRQFIKAAKSTNRLGFNRKTQCKKPHLSVK